MYRAAMILLALFAACVPTVLSAQEDNFTVKAAAEALRGFDEDFRQSACFNQDRSDARPLRIAIAELSSENTFEDYEDQAITDRIEEALATASRFQVVPRRLRFQLSEMIKALGEARNSTAPGGNPLDGIIAIKADTGDRGRAVDVVAYAYDAKYDAAGQRPRELCTGPIRTIPIGKITKAPIAPGKLFRRAAKKLPDQEMGRLVCVTAPKLVGFVNRLPAQVMAGSFQEQFADSVNEILQTRSAGINQPAGAGPPVAQPDCAEKEISGAWEARLRLTSKLPQRIDVRIDFFGPGGRPTGLHDTGYFAPDLLPSDSTPEVIAAAEAACNGVRQALEALSDPNALKAEAQKNLCPQLRKDLTEKAAAVDLGSLQDGRTVERSDRVDADNVSGVWVFRLTDAAAVGTQLDGLTDDLDADLRDSSWKIVARPGQSGPSFKEIETAGRMKPGLYYIRVAAAAGRRGSPYTLRVVKGALDTVGDAPETARNLGVLGLGAHTVSERIGGSDKNDVFRFSVQEPMQMKLTVGDLTSEVAVDLLRQGPSDQRAQVIRSSSYAPAGGDQNIQWGVLPGAIYYISVKPAGRGTVYSLGIALSHDPAAVERAARFELVHRAWQDLRSKYASDNHEDRRLLKEAFGVIPPSDRADLQPEQRRELDLVEAYVSVATAGTAAKWQEFLDQHRRDEAAALAQHELDVIQRNIRLEVSPRFEEFHKAWQTLQDNFPSDNAGDRASLESSVDQIGPYETNLTPDQRRELSLARDFLSGWQGSVETWRGVLERSKDRALTRIAQARLCDLQAANPNDLNKAASVDGVAHAELAEQAKTRPGAAADACAAAARAYPKVLRYRYQQARAMEVVESQRQRARALHEGLCRPSCDHPAACDNLGTILFYYQTPSDREGAIKAFEKGVQCGDPDAMLSLVDGIDNNWYLPVDKERKKCDLLTKAADLLKQDDRKRQAADLACRRITPPDADPDPDPDPPPQYSPPRIPQVYFPIPFPRGGGGGIFRHHR